MFIVEQGKIDTGAEVLLSEHFSDVSTAALRAVAEPGAFLDDSHPNIAPIARTSEGVFFGAYIYGDYGGNTTIMNNQPGLAAGHYVTRREAGKFALGNELFVYRSPRSDLMMSARLMLGTTHPDGRSLPEHTKVGISLTEISVEGLAVICRMPPFVTAAHDIAFRPGDYIANQGSSARP